MTPQPPFAVELFHELLRDMFVVKPDLQLYYELCGTPPPTGWRVALQSRLRQAMRSARVARVDLDNASLREKLHTLDPYWEGLQFLYERLDDSASKTTLVKVIAHRLLGALHVTLPADNARYRELLKQARELEDQKDTIDAHFRGWRLFRMDLSSFVSRPLSMYATAPLVHATFAMKQYEYDDEQNVIVAANPGDCVIDAGGCWGDTALYFANRVGEKGRVITFEFDPNNLSIFRRNCELNPELSPRIEIVEAPLWERAGETLTFSHNGPASRLDRNQTGGTTAYRTATIDEVMAQRPDLKAGFIKMDIEGAELPALRGAERTIRRDRPQLAISLYHSLEDFVQIPRWLSELDLNYRFHLGQKTIFDAETMLFAVSDS